MSERAVCGHRRRDEILRPGAGRAARCPAGLSFAWMNDRTPAGEVRRRCRRIRSGRMASRPLGLSVFRLSVAFLGAYAYAAQLDRRRQPVGAGADQPRRARRVAGPRNGEDTRPRTGFAGGRPFVAGRGSSRPGSTAWRSLYDYNFGGSGPLWVFLGVPGLVYWSADLAAAARRMAAADYSWRAARSSLSRPTTGVRASPWCFSCRWRSVRPCCSTRWQAGRACWSAPGWFSMIGLCASRHAAAARRSSVPQLREFVVAQR